MRSPLYCILNATEGRLDVILAHDDHVLAAQCWHAPTRGAEILTPALKSMLSVLKLKPTDITHFACVHGPGSFTGIRLIMGTVAAVRRITGAANATIDYMQALALTAHTSIRDGQNLITAEKSCMAVFTHARRNLVHGQIFSCHAKALPQPHAPTYLISPLGAYEQICELAKPEQKVYALGTGVKHIREYVQEKDMHIIAMHTEQPSVESLWQLALEAEYHHQDLEPLYVRPCDAVENLNHIAEKQGMDGTKAHEKLATLLQKDAVSDI